MLLNLLPTFSLLVIAILTFNHIPKSFCQDQQYVACGETFWCGNLSFSYPFWGGNRTSSCGYPGFELTCRENVTFLRVEPVTYRVLVVDALQRRLTLARDDLWSTLCPTYIHNTTFNTNIFTYSSSNQYLTLSYRCTILVANFSRPQNQFDCGVNTSTSSPSFYSTNTLGINPTNVGCSDAITVPVNEAAAQNLRSSEPLPAVLNGGFGLQWAANDTNCDRCIGSNGRCGYNSSTNSFVCYCSDRAYNLTCNNIQPQNGNGNGNGSSGLSVRVILALGISFGMVGLITIAVVYCVFKPSCEPMICWKPDKENNQNIEAFVRNYGSLVPKCYSFSELKKMTDSFGHPLGQGGYGFVYKGKLPDGRQVAVKVLRDNTGNGEEFINEVASISRTSHVNVVTLLGFCYKANRRALVYEFMSNGSLDKFICNNESQVANNRLEWRILYQIAVGIARGLEYLHRGCNTRIVHFDIKPQNILLDKDFCPKISDFGLAKLCENKQSILSTTGARGTVGYIAPEVVFRSIGGVSHKSDVYSYGIMVLEMVGLKSRIKVDTEKSSETYFPNWIYEHLELGKDIGLEGIVNAQEEEDARKMILVGLWCIQTKPSERPSMSKVVEMLEGSLQSLQIPPKPYLLDAPAVMRSSQGSSSTSFS